MRTTLDSMRVRLWQPAKLSTKFFSPTTQMLILIRWDSMFYTRMVPILETLTALLEYRHESSLCVIKTRSGPTAMSPFTLKSRKRLALWVNLLDGSDAMRILSSFFLQFNIVAQYSGACYKAHDIDSSSHSDKTSIVGWILIGMWAKTLYSGVKHLSKEKPLNSPTLFLFLRTVVKCNFNPEIRIATSLSLYILKDTSSFLLWNCYVVHTVSCLVCWPTWWLGQLSSTLSEGSAALESFPTLTFGENLPSWHWWATPWSMA